VEETSPLLELSRVSKQYDAFPMPAKVLKGVDLRLDPGEAVAVVGPSGCGKSTLLNIIGALDRPTSGSVTFKGRDVLELTPTDAAQFRNREIRQRVAVVRALINEPSLLLADEPTGSLNEEGADNLTALLLELNREEGMALLVVTHSLHVAQRMNRVLELHDGLLLPSR